MKREEISAIILTRPEVAAWPDLSNILTKAVSDPRQDWELPLLASRAVGGNDDLVTLAAAALVCVQISVTLVDDILDQDPRGAHLKIGDGKTANIALALQAIAFCLVEKIPVSAETRAAVNASLAQMALGTAFGQSLDVQNFQGEENYWKVVRAKSTPFYGTALQIGAILGQASTEIIEQVYEFGKLNGEIIQLFDDLTDALQKPATPDWKRPNNNLAILYAMTAQHLEREQFLATLPQIDKPDSLQIAQKILIHCGAVSYCVYHVVKCYQSAKQILRTTPLTNPIPLHDMLTHQIQPLLHLFKSVGADIPPELTAI